MNLIQQAQQAALEIGQDFTKTTEGSSHTLFPEGIMMVRFSEYIEKGKQKHKGFEGKPDSWDDTVRLGFQVLGGSGKDLEGNRVPYYNTEQEHPMTIRTFNTKMLYNTKSRFIKLFNAMNFKKAVSMVQLLGEAYLINCKIVNKMKDGKQVQINEFDFAGIREAIDPATGEPYNLPPLDESLVRVLLWDAPSKEQWDSLYIEGTKEDGSSKNFIQEEVMNAQNFVGSKLAIMLGVSKMPDGVSEVQEVPENTPNPEPKPVLKDIPEVPEVPKLD